MRLEQYRARMFPKYVTNTFIWTFFVSREKNVKCIRKIANRINACQNFKMYGTIPYILHRQDQEISFPFRQSVRLLKQNAHLR